MTRTLADTKTQLNLRLANLTGQLEVFKKDLDENPTMALRWSQSTFERVAEMEVVQSILVGLGYFETATDVQLASNSDVAAAFAGGATREELFLAWCRRTALEKMDFTTGSMATGNLYDHCVNRAWANLAKNFFAYYY